MPVAAGSRKTQIRETICALASGNGKAGVAVIRLSGPSASAVLKLMVSHVVEARTATFAAIRHPRTSDVIDHGIVLRFAGPYSFTGEDCVEFQVHGSRPVVSALLRALAGIDGVRLAEPGEFTRRALENGKLDLIGAEALADLIDAETEEQRKLASVEASGALRRLGERLRDDILDLMAIVEAELDFADEEEGPKNIHAEIAARLNSISAQLAKTAENYRCAEMLRQGLTVLIAGRPNAGKSSLLNALAKRDVAIVSEYAGTTRDLIEVRLDLSGFPVNLIDTAGIRASNEPVELEGIRRAITKSKSADLVLWLCPGCEVFEYPPDALGARELWKITTKADLPNVKESEKHDPQNLPVSVLTGQNLDVLIDRLKAFAKEHMNLGSSALVATERQHLAVLSALEAINAAKGDGLALEIVSEELRTACFALDKLIGKVGVEDVLDKLFSRFCIGK